MSSSFTAHAAVIAVVLALSACVQADGDVADKNRAPIAVAQSISTPEDSTVSITLAGTDTEGAALNFEIVALPAHGTISGTLPQISFRPSDNFNGTDRMSFRVSDGQAFSAAVDISITVTPVNDAPVAATQNVTLSEDGSTSIILAGNDIEGTVLSFEVVEAPTYGILTGTPPQVTYTPNTNYNGADQFRFRVSDGQATSPIENVSITVTAANDTPLAFGQSVTANRVPVAIMLSGMDAEGDSLTFTLLTQPVLGSLSGTPPELTYTPSGTGADSFTFRVSDGTAQSDPATIQIAATEPFNVRALLGPLAGASVEIYRYPQLDTPIATTTTSSGGDLADIGWFFIPSGSAIALDLYLVVVSGGEDHDVEDDGLKDNSPTPNVGKLHALVTGDQIGREALTVSLISEIAYHRATYMMAAGYPTADILDEMDRRAPLILSQDLTGDGNIDRLDLTVWDPGIHSAAVRFPAAEISTLAAAVRRNEAGLGDLLALSDALFAKAPIDSSFPVVLHGNNDHAFAIAVEPDALRLRVFDVSNPLQPSPQGSLDLSGTSLSFQPGQSQLMGDTLFVLRGGSSGATEVAVIDVTNPQAPVEVSAAEVTSSGFFSGLFYSEPVLYVSTGQRTLQTYFFNGLTLSFTGESTGSLFLENNLVAGGDYAYVEAENEQLTVWDVSAATGIRELGTVSVPGLDQVEDIELLGGRLFVSGLNGLAEFGLTDPSAPSLLRIYRRYWGQLQVLDGQLAVGNALLDASVPGDLSLVRFLPSRAPVLQVGSYYVSAEFNELTVADASADLPSRLVGQAEASARILDLASDGVYVYAGLIPGLDVFSTSGQGRATRIAGGTFGAATGSFNRLTYAANAVYLADLDGILRIVDVADPGNPNLVGQAVLSRAARDVAVDGALAFVASSGRLIAVDLTNPSAPIETGFVSGVFTHVAVRAGFAYVAGGSSALRVYDYRSGTPVLAATVPLQSAPSGASPFEVRLQDNLAIVSVSGQGVYYVDVTNPMQPELLGIYDAFQGVTRFLPDAGIGYAFSGAITVVDYGNPAAPRALYHLDLPEGASDAVRIGDYLYTRSANQLGVLPAIKQSVP